jgi:glycosyltransferase involved in cell wall biosynthesis
MQENLRICAVVPALDCAATITSVVEGIREQGISAVLVVDDGSSDDTAAIAEAAGAAVLRHPSNRGKGHALISGFRWALARGYDRIVTVDADGQHDPRELPRLLAAAETTDLVIGRRRIMPGTMPLSSFIGNLTSLFWVSLFCGQLCFDAQCGYRVYSRRLLEQVPLEGGRFETETELLLRAMRLGLPVRWTPIQTIYRGPQPRRTNFRTSSDPLRVIAVVVRSLRYPRAH